MKPAPRRAAAPAVLLAALAAASCGRARTPAAGFVRGNSYRNDYFALSLDVPAGWKRELRPEGLDRFLHYYLEMLTVREVDKDSSGRVFPLLRLSSTPLKNESVNVGLDDVVFSAAAARTGDKPGLDAARARLLAKELFDGAPAPLTVVEPFHAVALGGEAFDKTTFEIVLGSDTLHETIWVALRRGYALVFGAAAAGEKGLRKADAVADSIRFDPPAR